MAKPRMWWPGIRRGHPLARGLVSLWPLWEGGGSQSMDIVGGRHMTHYNTPTWRGSEIGTSLLFDDASTEYLEDASTCGLSGLPLSMAAWVRPDAFVNGAVISFGDTNANGWMELRLRDPADNDVILFDRFSLAKTTSSYSLDIWQHVCATIDAAGNGAVYLGGGNKGTNTGFAWNAGIDNTNIGRTSFNSTPIGYFSGGISVPGIWNRGLSDAEVQELYEDPWGLITPRRRTCSYVTGAPASGPGWWWGSGWREGAA